MKRLRQFFIGDYLAATDDVFVRSKIEMLYNYSMGFFLLGSVYYIHIVWIGLWMHVAAEGLAMLSLIGIPFILKYKQNVKLAAWIYIIQQLIVSACTIIIEGGEQNLISGFWISLYILLSFFLFEVKVGTLLLLAMILVGAVCGALAQVIKIPPENRLPMTPDVILLPLCLVIYITSTFMKTRKAAEDRIQEQKLLIEHRNKEVTDSITYAKRIQRAILPSDELIRTYLPQSFLIYLPKDIVSGDFYWLEKKDDKVYFAVADCTGHGVPGAMMSVICNNALNRVINEFEITSPGPMLDKLSELVEASFQKSGANMRDGMDIALCSLDVVSLRMEFAGANNSAYIIPSGADAKMIETQPNKQPVGFYEARKSFNNQTIQLNTGDQVYLFSDGIADQFGGPQGKKFKYKRVKELLMGLRHMDLLHKREAIKEAHLKWKGILEQVDDVCLFCVKV